LQTQQPLVTVAEFDAPVMHLAVNGDGSRVAAAAERGPILIIDAGSGKVLRTVRPQLQRITSLALSPDANRIAFGADDLTLRVRSLDKNQELTIRGTTGAFTCIVFSADGKLIAAGSQEKDVYICDADDGSVINRLGDHPGEIAGVGFLAEASDNRRVCSISADGAATVWHLGQSQSEADPNDHFAASSGTVVNASIDHSGHWLACAKGDAINIWNFAADKPPRPIGPPLKPPETVYSVAMDSTGQWCAAGLVNGDIVVMPVVQGH